MASCSTSRGRRSAGSRSASPSRCSSPCCAGTSRPSRPSTPCCRSWCPSRPTSRPRSCTPRASSRSSPPGSSSATSRRARRPAPPGSAERINWTTIQFLLENAVFLLIGLQVCYVLDDAAAAPARGRRRSRRAVGRALAVLVLRPIWVVPVPLPCARAARRASRQAAWRTPSSLSWAGMRGVVTLAAALAAARGHAPPRRAGARRRRRDGRHAAHPGADPARAGPRLGVRGPDPREDALQAATVLGARRARGSTCSSASTDVDDADAVDELRGPRPATGVNQMWERLGPRRGDDDETRARPTAACAREMLKAERDEVLRMRDDGAVPTTTCSARVMRPLDLEETMLDRSTTRERAARASRMLPAGPSAGELRAPRATHRDCPAADAGGVRGVPARRHDLGAPADVPRLRARRLLRLLGEQARDGALPRDRAPGDAQHRAGRGVALVLRRRGPRLGLRP